MAKAVEDVSELAPNPVAEVVETPVVAEIAPEPEATPEPERPQSTNPFQAPKWAVRT